LYKKNKGFIDSKAKIIFNNIDNNEYLDNNESIDKSLKLKNEQIQKKYNKKIKLFKMFLQNYSNQ
jgi:hypothetical protein